MTRRRRRSGCANYLARTDPVLAEQLRQVSAAAARFMQTRCNAESTVELPRRLYEDRRHYTCGREQGHDGPHRWPPDTGAIAEWEG